MTPQEINIAIAKACGWKPTQNKIKNYPTFQHADGRRCTIANLPNYHGDLNAMHEAEKVLDDNQWESYWYALARIARGRPTQVCHATAAQRAKAFVRTLNLWETP